MNIINKMILFIKNIFIKQKKTKKLEEPRHSKKQKKELNFAESLKIVSKRMKIETLICDGDGTGIQKKIRF